MTISIMTLSIKGLFVTLSITTLCITCHYAECHNAACRDLFIVILNVVMLTVIILNVIMLRFVILNVIMPSVIMLMSLCWLSLFWMSLCWLSSYWMSWHRQWVVRPSLLFSQTFFNCGSGQCYSKLTAVIYKYLRYWLVKFLPLPSLKMWNFESVRVKFPNEILQSTFKSTESESQKSLSQLNKNKVLYQ